MKGLCRQMLVLSFAYEIQMGKEQDSKRTASLNFRAFRISPKLLWLCTSKAIIWISPLYNCGLIWKKEPIENKFSC